MSALPEFDTHNNVMGERRHKRLSIATQEEHPSLLPCNHISLDNTTDAQPFVFRKVSTQAVDLNKH